MLRTASSKINVEVTVNGIPSVCKGDCSYNYITDSPVLTHASRNVAELTLSITDPAAIGYNLSHVTVSLYDEECTILNLSDPINNFTCRLPQNSDNTPRIPSGSYRV